MSGTRTRLREFILGLLTRQGVSGDDVRRFLSNLSWLIPSPSAGGLCPTLRALVQDGLATVEVVNDPGRRARKVYRPTLAGKRVLEEWIGQPAAPGTLRSFMMRLILARNLSPSGLVAYLRQRHSAVHTHKVGLEAAVITLDGVENFRTVLALDYGLTVAHAEVDWLERTIEQLSRQPPQSGSADRESGTAALPVDYP